MSLGIAVQLLKSGFRPIFTSCGHYIFPFSLMTYDEHSLLWKHLQIFYTEKALSIRQKNYPNSKHKSSLDWKCINKGKKSSKQPYWKQIGLLS